MIQAGDTPPAYYIASGIVWQYDIAENGDKLILNTYKEGAFISLATILNDIPSELFFEAAGHVVVHTAPASDVNDFLHTCIIEKLY